jgi:hypothetical protein
VPSIIDYDYTAELKAYKNVIIIDTLIETLDEFISLFTLNDVDYEVTNQIFKQVYLVEIF